MRIAILFCLVGACYGAATLQKRQVPFGAGRHVQQRYQGNGQHPQGFRASPIDDDSREEIDRNAVQPTHSAYIARPQNIPFRQDGPRGRPQDHQGKRPGKPIFKDEELEEEEKEEPDRLTMLLPQSKFNCQGKNTGYYADEGLSCEVFHYCQDNSRHSWICPEGFLFHQVHLICMPPSTDNICSTSSQFHFVNDFLYKPLNADEHLRNSNITLRYSDRYYPENFYDEEFGAPTGRVAVSSTPLPRPVQSSFSPRPHQLQQPQQNHHPHLLRQNNQVFHSPEEVNIPLQHRRPSSVSQSHRNIQAQSSEEYEY